ncbi:MAG: metal-dependent transcriptional regulator [Acidilobaceae archaeon]
MEDVLSNHVLIKYLRAIFMLGGCPGRNAYVKLSDLSKVLSLSLPTVSIMVRRLEDRGFVSVKPREGVLLTWKGLELLAEYCWKKSIVEVVLNKLGLPLGDVEKISDKVSHVVDRDSVVKMWDCLGRPKECSHGYVILGEWSDKEKVIEWLRGCCKLHITRNNLEDYVKY